MKKNLIDRNIIFGGSGFIGKHLIDRLESDYINYDIIHSIKNYKYCDIRDKIDLSISVDHKTVIYNLAALCTIPKYDEKEYYDTNVLGAINICNFARKNKVNKIVFTSSISPYGMREQLVSEDSMPMPTNEYGTSKLIAEHVHRLWQAEKPDKRTLVILRPGIVFGKGENGNFERLYKSLSKGFFFYPGRRDTKKACIYVKDLVNVLINFGKNASPGILLLNCCYPAPHSIEQICLTICKVTNIKKPKLLIPSWILKKIALFILILGKLINKPFLDIHPDRVEKLMVSTNVSGSKLHEIYPLEFSLENAVEDWFNDCKNKGLL